MSTDIQRSVRVQAAFLLAAIGTTEQSTVYVTSLRLADRIRHLCLEVDVALSPQRPRNMKYVAAHAAQTTHSQRMTARLSYVLTRLWPPPKPSA